MISFLKYVNESKNVANISLVGDIMFSRGVNDAAKFNKYSVSYYKSLFKGVKHKLNKSDIVFGNLETAVSKSAKRAFLDKLSFRSHPNCLKALSHYVDIVSLANNHILDYGEKGLNDTIKHLENNHIEYIGIDNETHLNTSKVIETKSGIKIGFLAYIDEYIYPDKYEIFDYKPIKLDLNIVKSDIDNLKDKVDHIIVSIHGGEEYHLSPNEYIRSMYRSIIDMGASIIAGHHPHVHQPAEIYNGGIIVYSLGNFIFDQTRQFTGISALYQIKLNKNTIKDVSFYETSIIQGSHYPIINIYSQSNYSYSIF